MGGGARKKRILEGGYRDDSLLHEERTSQLLVGGSSAIGHPRSQFLPTGMKSLGTLAELIGHLATTWEKKLRKEPRGRVQAISIPRAGGDLVKGRGW